MRLFYFRLARELGMPVGIMLKSMTSHEIGEWHAFFRYEAREQERARKRAQLDAQVRARASGTKRRRR